MFQSFSEKQNGPSPSRKKHRFSGGVMLSGLSRYEMAEIDQDIDYLIATGQELKDEYKQLSQYRPETRTQQLFRATKMHLEDFRLYQDLAVSKQKETLSETPTKDKTSNKIVKYKLNAWPNEDRNNFSSTSLNSFLGTPHSEWEKIFGDSIDNEDFTEKYLTNNLVESLHSNTDNQKGKKRGYDDVIMNEFVQKCWERAVHAANNIVPCNTGTPKNQYNDKNNGTEIFLSNCSTNISSEYIEEEPKQSLQKQCDAIKKVLCNETLSIVDNYLHILMNNIKKPKSKKSRIDYDSFLTCTKDAMLKRSDGKDSTVLTSAIDTVRLNPTMKPFTLNDEVFDSIKARVVERYQIKSEEQRMDKMMDPKMIKK